MDQNQLINGYRRLLFGVVVCGSLLLTGCQNRGADKWVTTPAPNSQSAAKASTQVVAPEPEPISALEVEAKVKESRIGICQSELASLKTINPQAYAVRKDYFNRLVNSVSVYSSVRGEVNTQTKNTLDALYKYKTNYICSDIERDVLEGLIHRGESVK